MRSRVLVFPCGSEIGLEIHNALQYSKHFELVGASSVSSNHGKYVFKQYANNLPFVDRPDFIRRLAAVVKRLRIDFIYPAHDSVVLKLAGNESRIGCRIVGSPAETCRICRSKLKTYDRFRSLLPVPKIYRPGEDFLPFPLFLKPDVGQGSRGTFTARSPEEVRVFCRRDPSLLLLEYLPGKEYTVDCFTDRFGKLRFVGPRERLRVMSGISVDTRPVQKAIFREMARIINKTLRFRGAWFFQVKSRAKGELVLMEIAPRIAGAMGLYRNLGINFPMLSLHDALEQDIQILSNRYALEMDRALVSRFRSDLRYRHVYMDLDDALILNNRINPVAIAFLYQCRNNKIKIHMLSRHHRDIRKTLKRFRIDGLFDSVTHLGTAARKSDFIRQPSAIFIDDSFSERSEVKIHRSIPVFDVDAIESLLDWRTPG